MFNLEGLIPKLCQLAREVGKDDRKLSLRSAGLQALASMVFFTKRYTLFYVILFFTPPRFTKYNLLLATYLSFWYSKLPGIRSLDLILIAELWGWWAIFRDSPLLCMLYGIIAWYILLQILMTSFFHCTPSCNSWASTPTSQWTLMM